MQYINPFTLLQIQNVDLVTNQEIQKKIDDFFSSVDVKNNWVLLGSHKVHQDHILKYKREFTHVESLEIHRVILKDDHLFQFLELGQLDIFHKTEFHYEPQLIQFITGYFAFQFSESLLKALEKKDLEQINLLCNCSDLPGVTDFEHLYFQSSLQWLDDKNDELEKELDQVSWFSKSEREIQHIITEEDIHFMDHLPSLFDSYKRDFYYILVHFAHRLKQEGGRTEASEIILKSLSKINFGPELNEELSKAQSSLSKNKWRMPLFLAIGIGVIVLLFLIQWFEKQITR
jgi:hypothetical protein